MSWVLLPRARKPVAINRSARLRSSPAGRRSPAICSRTNWSYGLSALNDGDHPVAVAPGLGVHQVRLAARLGEPRHVEPVPAPALAEAGRGEQPIDDLREGVGRVVGDERVDFFRGGRQADEVEGHAAEERLPVGVGDGRESFGFERGEEEAVDVGLGQLAFLTAGGLTA